MAQNARNIVAKYPEYGTFIGIVKGDAYGHGYGIVNTLYDNGIRYFAVSSMEEAAAFRRENAEAPLLCLEPVAIDRLDEAAELNSRLRSPMRIILRCAARDRMCLSVSKLHIQIDSGFNRLGFKDKHEVKQAADMIANNPIR